MTLQVTLSKSGVCWMKRDLDLCLEILRHIEGSPEQVHWASQIANVIGKAQQAVAYNCCLLFDAELLLGKEHDLNDTDPIVARLTWNGHEFLDASRDPTHWEKAKDVAQKSSGGFELIRSVLSSLATEAAKAMAGL